MHDSSYNLMKDFVRKYIYKGNRKCRVLDVGSQIVDNQVQSHKDLFVDHPEIKYIGCDMVKGRNVDIVLKAPYNWSNIPSNSFDFVISASMLEHVEFPWLTFVEINRVLKPGGMCCVIAPSAGLMHNYPLDCYRYFPDGISALASYANLEVVDAFAQWEHDKYPNMNFTWKDCVLIAKKRDNTVKNIVSDFIRRKCIQMASKACNLKKEFISRNPVLDCNEYAAKTYFARMYYDTGYGYNKTNYIKMHYRRDWNNVHLDFEMPEEEIVGLRLVPAQRSCLVTNLRIHIDGRSVRFKAKNAEITDQDFYLFKVNDPIFVIDHSEKSRVRTVSVDFEVTLCNDLAIDRIIKLISENNNLQN